MAALNLYYLGRLAEKPAGESFSAQIGAAFPDQVRRAQRGFSALLQSVQVQVAGSREIVIAGNSQDLDQALTVLRKYYDLHTLTLDRPNEDFKQIEQLAGFRAYQKATEARLTVYICENYACQQPLRDLESLKQALEDLRRD